MLLTFVLFIIGFIILIKGAGILVDGASSIARLLGISSWIIGLTIVGVGTSIPEFAISLFANIVEKSGISLGTIVGSNTFNLLVITGVSALISPLFLKRKWVVTDLVINIASVLVFLFFTLDGQVERWEGLVLIGLFAAWIIFITHSENKIEEIEEKNGRGVPVFTLPISIVMMVAGLIGVYFGGNWVVNGAAALAKIIGATETFIALTVIAIGTSLPELVVSAAAAYKRNPALAIGNIIGSNIFDFLGIIGIVSLVRPMIISQKGVIDTVVTLAAAGVVLLLSLMGKRFHISRKQGLLMIVLYLIYFAYLVYRGVWIT
jgi:cation:H+ antiporter